MAKWVKEYNPNLVAQRLDKVKNVFDGKVSFKGFDHLEGVVLLNSMVKLNDEVPEIEKQRIINQATFKAAAKGLITTQSILKEISKLEKEYLLKEKITFRLITSISISSRCKLPRVSLDGSCIVIHAHLNKTTRENRNEIINAQNSISSQLPNNYANVSVSVKARSAAEAADKALESLDLIRGILNLWNNRSHNIRISSGYRAPVNRIVLGPIHTLHYSNGNLATKTWWYEPQYQSPINLFDESNKTEFINKFMANFRGHLKKSNYKSDIIQALVRYVRALDSRDWDDSFLKLWGVLEFLTGTLSDSYNVTIRRASYMFDDKEYMYQVLSHLRDYRNKSVHVGSTSSDIESLMFQLKRYVEVLIQFHVGNKYRFSSIKDAAEFMDSPTDKAMIDKKIKKLRYARKFISGSYK